MAAPDRKVLIGKTFPAVKRVISEDDIKDYLPVAGEEHPAFVNDAGARAAGYERRVIPPSFAPFLAILGMLHSFDWKKDFFLDYRTGTAMFGEQELEYFRPLYVGETLTIQGTVSDVYEKQGKRVFDVAKVKVTATDERGAVAFQGAMSYILFK
jgi:acyl dehydratase